MPFVWYTYGELGVYGYTMLGNSLFVISIVVLFISILTTMGPYYKGIQAIFSTILLASYILHLHSFLEQLPFKMEIGVLLKVCHWPFYASFIMANLLVLSMLFSKQYRLK